jgi:hypothetical protein
VDNVVHHNNFADNGAGSQGSDNNGNNTWDDGVSEGNYWDDWSGNGTYALDGGVGAEDRYPLSTPVNTSAPQPIPEAPVLTVMAFVVVVFAAVFRRRRLR